MYHMGHCVVSWHVDFTQKKFESHPVNFLPHSKCFAWISMKQTIKHK
jgi:hypothetical protein